MAISVIIPTYSSPDALDLCLRSAIEGQQNENQIIVVVDGFYELNREVLDKYEEDIEVLDLGVNHGLCAATNLGVYNAKHEKILIVNDDNVFPKDWDFQLELDYQQDTVLSPNQIEPTPSMFPQFHINDLGRDPKSFNLDGFWKYEEEISIDKIEGSGSTLPIFMSKTNFLRVGGWDEKYELGVVADWDFFLKCLLSGMAMNRDYNLHFYHFVSLSTSTTLEQQQNRQQVEMECHEYAVYKWGSRIKHNSKNNEKTI